jgi:hypothetical protein
MESDRLARLPKTPVVIEGVTYNLCGDLAALVEAEAFFNLRGYEVNMAASIFDLLTKAALAVDAVTQIFPCAIHTFHPALDFLAAKEMIDISSIRPISEAIGKMWPVPTKETEAASDNLSFDLPALAEANEFFAGKAGLSLIFVEGPFTLDHVCRLFPCAVHQFRPELTLSAARRLMILRSVAEVVGGFGLAYQAASQETKDRFIERVCAVASEEEKQEIIFRIMAKKPWPGAGQA